MKLATPVDPVWIPGGADLGELAALLVAHIPRWGPNELGDRVALHVLAHVQPHHRRLRPEVTQASPAGPNLEAFPDVLGRIAAGLG